MIESHMRAQPPKSEEGVFVLTVAERTAVLATGEPKMKMVHALNQELKAPKLVAFAVAPRSAARIGSNISSNNSISSSNNNYISGLCGGTYCPSDIASDAGPREVILRSKQSFPRAMLRDTPAAKWRNVVQRGDRTLTNRYSSDSK